MKEFIRFLNFPLLVSFMCMACSKDIDDTCILPLSESSCTSICNTHSNPASYTVIMGSEIEIKQLNDPTLKQITEQFGLVIGPAFKINAAMHAFTLHTTSTIQNPVEIGKKISLMNNVLMVEIEGLTTS